MNFVPTISDDPGDAQAIEARLKAALERQRQSFLADGAVDLATRRDRLRRLERMIREHEDAFCAAIDADFGRRSPAVTRLTEIVPTRSSIRHAMRRVKNWMRPRRVGVTLALQPARASILRQPIGVVGIVAPWNYPLTLLLNPLVGALAAGNRAMLKPSELTPRFSTLLEEAIAAHFDATEVTVCPGGPDVAMAFTALPFDHLIFTGSTAIGRKVAEAAAKNLTPVTLELGGKSPAILDRSARMEESVDRLIWGKLLNSGQTCVSPDYVLVAEEHLPAFLAALKTAVQRQYPTFRNNPDYTSIITARHYERLVGLIDDARAKGAEIHDLGEAPDPQLRILPPVVMTGMRDEMAIMQEEIFGPILPVLTYQSIDEAIAYVKGRDRPLALYWFGEDGDARRRICEETLSGGVAINDTILHLSQEDLPFGGIGASGYGHYHGEHGFLALTKEKSVLRQSRLSSVKLLYPPYGGFALKLLKILGRLA